jgi:CIC family chloride channel protein
MVCGMSEAAPGESASVKEKKSAGPRPLITHAHRHYVRAAIVGTLVGVVAVAFQWSIALAEHWRGMLLARLHAAPHSAWWGWAVLPAIGLAVGGLVGFAVQRWAPEASGSGIPHIKGVLIHIRRLRWERILPIKFVGAASCIGVGLSMGREGPTVQMGAAVGKLIGSVLRVPSRLLPQLISSGAGAGLTAAFNAPLAGFLFVLEELHREMSALTFGGALVAAVSADIVTRSLTGQLPSFSVQGFPALPLSALPSVVALGIVCGVLGVVITKGLLAFQAGAFTLVKRTGMPRWVLPGIAGALVGLVAWWLPDAVGGGHEVADRLLSGRLPLSVGVLVLLLGTKLLMTLISYASGAPGGIFAPMLLMGAIAGTIAARIVGHLQPTLGRVDAFAVIGMAAVFTGCVRAPLTGIVLILEMTSNYEQLLSLCVACLAAYFVADLLRSPAIYEALLEVDIKRHGLTPEGGEKSLESVFESRSVVMGIQRDAALQGKKIRDAGLPTGCLVVAVERGGKELLPKADLVLAPGDHITVLTPADEPEKALAVVDLARAK